MLERSSIRRANLADFPKILEIERASFGRHAYDRNLFADYLHRCGDLFLVAEQDGRVCGYVLTCIASRQSGVASGRRAELVSVAVAPESRGTGAAKALLDSTLRRLRRRGVARLSLTVRVANERARFLYTKYGFEKVRIVRGYYEDGQDGLLMAKYL